MKKSLNIFLSFLMIFTMTSYVYAANTDSTENLGQPGSWVVEEITPEQLTEIENALANEPIVSPRFAAWAVGLSGTKGSISVNCGAVSSSVVQISGTVTIVTGSGGTPTIKKFNFYPSVGYYTNDTTWYYTNWKSATLDNVVVINSNGEKSYPGGETIYNNY